MRIVVSGGGTGGHVIPVLALCAALRAIEPGVTLDFIGSGGALERDLVGGQDIRYHIVSSGKLRRYGRGVAELMDIKTLGLNARDSWRLLRGLNQARRLLKQLKPNVVFVKGGYVGLPVGLATTRLRIPLVIHESDIVMGLTNRILASRAQLIATGFPVESFAGVKTTAPIIATGNPVRNELAQGKRDQARRHFGIDTKLPTLLIIGGSLGAHTINECVWAALPELTQKMNVIHQTGVADVDAARFVRQRLQPLARRRYVPEPFLQTELADAYALADVVVARSGANTLAELALLQKAAILIPLPSSTNNHQTLNAHYIVRRGAARLLEQDTLTPRRLIATIEQLIGEPADQKYLGQAIGRLAVPNAAEQLAEIIIQIARKHYV